MSVSQPAPVLNTDSEIPAARPTPPPPRPARSFPFLPPVLLGSTLLNSSDLGNSSSSPRIGERLPLQSLSAPGDGFGTPSPKAREACYADDLIAAANEEIQASSSSTPRTILSPRFDSPQTNLSEKQQLLLENIRAQYTGSVELLNLQKLTDLMEQFYSICLLRAVQQIPPDYHNETMEKIFNERPELSEQIILAINSKNSLFYAYCHSLFRFYKHHLQTNEPHPSDSNKYLFAVNLKSKLEQLISLDVKHIIESLFECKNKKIGQAIAYILFGETDKNLIKQLIEMLNHWQQIDRAQIISDLDAMRKTTCLYWTAPENHDPKINDIRRTFFPDTSKVVILNSLMINSLPLRLTGFADQREFIQYLVLQFAKKSLLPNAGKDQLQAIVDLFISAQDLLGSSRELSEEEKSSHDPASIKKIIETRQIETKNSLEKKRLPQPFFNLLSGSSVGEFGHAVMLLREKFYKYKKVGEVFEALQGEHYVLKCNFPDSVNFFTDPSCSIKYYTETIYRKSDVAKERPLAVVHLYWTHFCREGKAPYGELRIVKCDFCTTPQFTYEGGVRNTIEVNVATKEEEKEIIKFLAIGQEHFKDRLRRSFSAPLASLKRRASGSSTSPRENACSPRDNPTSPRPLFSISSPLPPDTPSPREASPRISPGRSVSLTHSPGISSSSSLSRPQDAQHK